MPFPAVTTKVSGLSIFVIDFGSGLMVAFSEIDISNSIPSSSM